MQPPLLLSLSQIVQIFFTAVLNVGKAPYTSGAAGPPVLGLTRVVRWEGFPSRPDGVPSLSGEGERQHQLPSSSQESNCSTACAFRPDYKRAV